MKKPYQIEAQRAVKHLEGMAAEGNPAVQMVLPMAEVVGWLAYDAEEHDLTRRMNQESLYFARLAGDRTIELLTLQNSSMHAAKQGRPREALHIARSVLEGDYRLSPRLKALFLTRKARALAQGGDESALRLSPRSGACSWKE